eukprot:comp23639_c0_seq1/m.40319 comp23639_c0_seq1/g.40319  ORF comp23639_c0_seq1/g.40319 comp23639_c0_seq1/m.40319 type:complete len:644 (-) comp23639_c0_seq1:138-2069(-)
MEIDKENYYQGSPATKGSGLKDLAQTPIRPTGRSPMTPMTGTVYQGSTTPRVPPPTTACKSEHGNQDAKTCTTAKKVMFASEEVQAPSQDANDTSETSLQGDESAAHVDEAHEQEENATGGNGGNDGGALDNLDFLDNVRSRKVRSKGEKDRRKLRRSIFVAFDPLADETSEANPATGTAVGGGGIPATPARPTQRSGYSPDTPTAHTEASAAETNGDSLIGFFTPAISKTRPHNPSSPGSLLGTTTPPRFSYGPAPTTPAQPSIYSLLDADLQPPTPRSLIKYTERDIEKLNAERDAVISERESTIGDLHRTITEKDSHLAEIQNELVAKSEENDAIREEMGRALEIKTRDLEEVKRGYERREREMAEAREREIGQLRAQVEQREREMGEMITTREREMEEIIKTREREMGEIIQTREREMGEVVMTRERDIAERDAALAEVRGQLAMREKEAEGLRQEAGLLQQENQSLLVSLGEAKAHSSQMGLVLTEYQTSIERLVAEAERERQAHAAALKQMQEERDKAVAAAQQWESRHEDLYENYRTVRNNSAAQQENLEKYKKALEQSQENQKVIYAKAQEKLGEANRHIASLEEQKAKEQALMEARLQKSELGRGDLEHENAALKEQVAKWRQSYESLVAKWQR